MPRDADETTLHRAFRLLSKSLHPDTTSLPSDQAKIKFHAVKEAYELLADPQLRKLYDARLNAEAAYQRTLDLGEISFNKRSFPRENQSEVRRPFSGGELFSLLLLIGSILLSLLLGLFIASAHGKEMQVLPSWLSDAKPATHVLFQDLSNVNSSPT